MQRDSQIAAILFDKDGNLVDFDATFGPAGYGLLDHLSNGDAVLMQRLAAALDYDLEPRLFRHTSPFAAEPTPIYGAILADILGCRDRVRLFQQIDATLEALALHWVTPIGDPQKVLGSLAAAGLELGIATNDAEHIARQQAERPGLRPFLRFYAGYVRTTVASLVREWPWHLPAISGHPPSRIALVGDSRHDMLAARAAGCRAIAVLSGPASRAALSLDADHVIDQIGDLPALLAAFP